MKCSKACGQEKLQNGLTARQLTETIASKARFVIFSATKRPLVPSLSSEMEQDVPHPPPLANANPSCLKPAKRSLVLYVLTC